MAAKRKRVVRKPVAPPINQDVTSAPDAFEGVKRLRKDLREGAKNLGRTGARFLVDMYYAIQDARIRMAAQLREVEAIEEPDSAISYFVTQWETLENQAHSVLDAWSDKHPIGRRMRTVAGVGPVMASALLAHTDPNKSTTAGKLWRFAGLDPTVKWVSRDKADAWVAKNWGHEDIIGLAATTFGRNVESFRSFLMTDKNGKARKGALKQEDVAKAIARRPWNASLKVACWKLGESFTKVSGNPDAFYGQVYANRKAVEMSKNINGDFADQAQASLVEKKFGDDTDAILWLRGCMTKEAAEGYYKTPPEQRLGYVKKYAGKPGSGPQMLPPARIQLRAQRAAVKLFLAHFQEALYRHHHGKAPPLPWVIEFGGHQDHIPCPW